MKILTYDLLTKESVEHHGVHSILVSKGTITLKTPVLPKGDRPSYTTETFDLKNFGYEVLNDDK